MPAARLAVRWVCAWAVACAVLGPGPSAVAADFDADGIADAADNCPKVPNPTQADSAGVGSLEPNGRGNACECGDVTSDGGAQVNDATVIRRAFVGLGPGLARPELCNATGAVDARDLDRDGVRDDCDLADLVVLRRALVGLGPGIGSECGLIFSPDALQPRVTLTAPGEVSSGQGFTAAAQAEDDRGVGLLEIRVDGLRVGQVGSGGPLSVPVVAPALPGSEIAIEARAEDAAGNAGSASARVRVVQVADTTAPSVSLSAPPRAAPGSTLLLKASASDARGVESVVFYASGQQVAVDASPPYEASFTLPASAVVGSVLPVEARAQDASGNEASASAGVQIAANGDAAAPTQVALSVPAQAKPGQTLGASATAQDDVGILAIEFFVDGAMIAEDASAPYTASFPIPASRAPGERLVWTARARDFAGNSASSPEATTLLVAAGTGLVSGEVYDDSRSQPLAGARVRVVEAGGQPLAAPLELVSDARGRFSAPLVEGPAYLEVSKDGYSGAERALEVRAGQVDAPLDARLTPRGAAHGVDPVAGTTLSEGALALALPPGAFAAATPLRVTALSEQGLPSPLPPGWSPLAAAELEAPAALRTEARLAFGELVPPVEAIGARWDAPQRKWRRVALEGAELTLDALGAVAIAVPDAVPPPAVGEALAGVALAALPATASAQILPSPRILFPDPAARSQVTARVETALALPSGTPLALEFRESYRRSDGSTLEPEGSTQDFLLYRRASGLEAEFAATPSEVFDGALLTEGEIDLTAQASAAATTALANADAAGGALSRDGVSVQIPAGALAGPAPLSLVRISSAPTLPVGMSLVAGVQFALAGAPLSAPAVLRVAAPTSLPADAQVLVVRSVRVGSATRLELVGIAAREGAELVLRPGALGLPLPGADAAGSYLFVAPEAPLGFVAGVLRGAPGAPLARALVETGSLPFVSLVDAADPRFALAAGAGSAALDATELASGARASGAIAVSAGNVSALDLTLASARPSVAAIDPADLAAQIDVDAAITVRFTRPLERGSVTAQSFRLLDGSTPVAGQLSFGLGALSVTFRPEAPLRGLSAYTVALSGAIRDEFGNALLGNQLDGSYASVFETWDTAPPAKPAAGRITLSIPRDGETEIRGTPGTLAAGMLVFAFNRATGVSTAATVEANGSFFALLGASSDDEIVLGLQTPAGAFSQLEPIPFTDPGGTAVLSPRGGRFASSGGVGLSVLPGALVGTDEVRVTDVPEAELPADLPAGLTVLRGFRLQARTGLFHSVARLSLIEETGRILGAERSATPLRIEASRVTGAGITPITRFAFVARAADAQGVERAVRVEATGNSTACTGSLETVSDAVTPRLRLAAPTCLGPQQAFSVRAEAIQPRFDLETDAAPGDLAGASYLILRRAQVGSRVVWILVETARVEISLGVAHVISESRAPLGLRDSGEYVIARASSALGFVEGVVAGDAALVATDRSTLGARTEGSNGAFLLAVPAGQPFVLRTLSPDEGSEQSSQVRAAIGAGATSLAGFVGPSAPVPLSLNALPPDGGTLAPTAPVVFGFNGPVDVSTLSASSLVVLDAAGRLIDGERVARAGGSLVEFQPHRPWRGGETYTWRVTTEVIARDGARLAADATGSFSGFGPALLTTLAGDDVRDAVARGSVIYIADGSRVRSVDSVDPLAPIEGAAISLSPAPNQVSFDLAHDSLLVTAGSTSDYGEVLRLDLANALAPALSGRLRISTPSGAAPIASAAALPGSPASLAPMGSALAISNRGIGLQRIELAAFGVTPPAAPPVAFPPGGASFADVASLGPLLVSVGPSGLQLHDPLTLAVLGSAAIDGTPADVELVAFGGHDVALVAAGLVGGVQAFEITPPSIVRVAKVLPGCAVQRISADAAMGRAWLACSGTRLASLDIAHLAGLEPIDADQDGADDRVGAPFVIPVPLVDFSLDAPRNLGLVSSGSRGLALVQLGGAEARIADVVRDPLSVDIGDAQSILASGRAFRGDRRILVTLDARLPPNGSAFTASIEGDAPLAFADGARSRALVAGRNELSLEPGLFPESAARSFSLRISDESGREVARFSGSFADVPLDEIVQAFPPSGVSASELGNTAIEIAGRGRDNTYYDLGPLAEFEVEDAALASVVPGGSLQIRGGGSTSVRYSVGAESGSFSLTASVPPVLSSLRIEPPELLLRALGASQGLTVSGRFTDGSTRDLPVADLVVESLDASIASVESDGRVVARREGNTRIGVRSGSISGSAAVRVSVLVPPDVAGISLTPVRPVSVNQGVLFATGRVLGTGSLEDIAVRVRLDGAPEGPVTSSVTTNSRGDVSVELGGVTVPGDRVLRLEVTDPSDGAVFSAQQVVRVEARDGDYEPNDAPASAIGISEGAVVAGTLDPVQDASDLYRFEVSQQARLSARVSSTSADSTGLRLLAADGSEIGVATLEPDPESGAANGLLLARLLEPGTYLFEVRAPGGPVEYTLSPSLERSIPRIDSIQPPAAAPGATIAILGSGFSERPEENTVLFGGVLAEVRSAGSERLEAFVPAFAMDGNVEVWVAGRASNAVAFATGQQGDLRDLRFYEDDEPAGFVIDPASGASFSPDRILVGFRLSTTRARAEQIAQESGALIAGLFPKINTYVFRYADVVGTSELSGRLAEMRQRPEVDYASRVYAEKTAGFPIAARDRLSPVSQSAYAQIRLFEAWETIIDNGVLDGPTPLAPVKIAVLDEPHFPNALNAALLDGVVTSRSWQESFSSTHPAMALHPPPFCYTARDGRNLTGTEQERRDKCPLKDPVTHEVLTPLQYPPPRTDSHGTAVSSVIGALNVDAARPTGVAAGILRSGAAPYYSIDQFDTCSCVSLSSSFRTSVLEHFANQYDVVNLSFGSDPEFEDLDLAAQERVWARLIGLSPRTLFVVAAGNEDLPARREYPAAMGNHSGGQGYAAVGNRILTVANTGQGSTVHGDLGSDRRALTSNYGSAVDIAAPGMDVPVANAFTNPSGLDASTGTVPSFSSAAGTSFSAPLVAGAAVLLKAIRPSLTAEDLHRILVDTATPIGVLPRSAPGGGHSALRWDDWQLPVRLDVLSAVQNVLACNAQANPPAGQSATCPRLSDLPPAPADAVGATRVAPGRRRSFWVADSSRGFLYHTRLRPNFGEQNLGARSAPLPFDVFSSCIAPVGLAMSPDGAKLYVACGGNESILVWNTQTRAPGRAATGTAAIDLGSRLLSVVGNNIRLGMSPDGNYLAVPVLEGGKPAVAVIDARADRVLTQVLLGGAAGVPTAAVFDSRNNLFVITSKPPRIDSVEDGTLFRIERKASSSRTDTSAWSGTAIRKLALPTDEPRGLEIATLFDQPVLHVYYSGDLANTALTSHGLGDLVSFGGVPDHLPGHGINIVPGREVPAKEINRFGHQVPTSTHRAFDLAIQQRSLGVRGFLLFSWTGNLGVLEPPDPLEAVFASLRAVTAIRGKVLGQPVPAYKLSLDAAAGLLQLESTLRTTNVDVDREELKTYFTTEFGQAMELEQGGQLLVSAFTGAEALGAPQRGFLGLSFPDSLMQASGVFLEEGGPPVTSTPLDALLAPANKQAVYRLDASGLDAPRDVKFLPQLSVLVPRAGETVRGAVPVNVVIRDERIRRITCRLTPTQGGGAAFGTGGSLSSTAPSLGLTWRSLPDRPQLSMCFLAQLPSGDYVLEVLGEDQVGMETRMRVPFRYEQ